MPHATQRSSAPWAPGPARFIVLVCLLALVPCMNASRLSQFFGTKRHYFPVEDHNLHAALRPEARQHLADHCKPTSVYMVIRHSSRWPTAKHMSRYLKLAAVNWTSPFTQHVLDEGLLTPRGVHDARELGAQVASSDLRDLFAQGYHPRRFELKSSRVIRALQTAHGFAAGAFGSQAAVAIMSESLHVDTHLRFHKTCSKYQAHKPTAMSADEEARVGKVMDDVVTRLVDTTGARLSHKGALALWSACKFEVAAFDKADGACAFFNDAVAAELEYVEDVKDHWAKGSGHALNHDMTCDLVKDIAQFTAAGNVTGKFMFGHAETILPLVARLGLFTDVIVEGALPRARKWRTGVVSPFTANVAIVSFACDDGQSVVDVRHNQRSLDVSHLCPEGNHGLCSKLEFLQALRSDCDQTSICQI